MHQPAPRLGEQLQGNHMFTQEDIQTLTRATAYDPSGQKIGQVATVYQDRVTGEPEWLTVKTGLFGRKEIFVPLALARTRGDREVELAADKDTVTSAPKIAPEAELFLAQEEQLYSYYGLGYGEWLGLPETSGQTAAEAYRPPGAQGLWHLRAC
jgi:PRC-barrel domain